MRYQHVYLYQIIVNLQKQNFSDGKMFVFFPNFHKSLSDMFRILLIFALIYSMEALKGHGIKDMEPCIEPLVQTLGGATRGTTRLAMRLIRRLTGRDKREVKVTERCFYSEDHNTCDCPSFGMKV